MHYMTILADKPPRDDDYLGLKEQLAYIIEAAIGCTPRDIEITHDKCTDKLIFGVLVELAPKDSTAKLATALADALQARYKRHVRLVGMSAQAAYGCGGNNGGEQMEMEG